MRGSRRNLWFYAMVGPAIFGFLAFSLLPMLYSLYLSFTRYTVVQPPEWIGIEHYIYLFYHDPSFWPSVKVTLVFAVFQVPLALTTSLSIALLLNCQVRFLGVYRTIYYVPSILPSAASAAIFVYIFNPEYGLLNHFLARVGVEGPAWLDSTAWALPTLIVISLWAFGNAMLIFLGGLQGVDRALYESATIDGAGTWRRFLHVTMPQISPVFFFNLVMGIIGALRVFDLAYAFGAAQGKTPGGPAQSTLFYVLNLYQRAFNYFHMGQASAMAWILFAITVGLTWLNFRLARKWVHHE